MRLTTLTPSAAPLLLGLLGSLVAAALRPGLRPVPIRVQDRTPTSHLPQR